ncbi:MAG TPA: adenylyltransferase/cytidyltransferase family protein [Patescibacteria group bacterium]|nr:adenylyltransferase/cytidyltransferase family protein [Patescibacteria group bacterium]
MHKVGLVVGRFQPFHKGHLYLLNEVLKACDKIIIAVGSSNVSNENNPLSYATRVEMLKKVILEEGLGKRVIKIVPSPDDPSDDKWLELLLKEAGKIDIAFGNNEWTNGILERAGYEVIEVPYLNRVHFQGVYIRNMFSEGKPWEEEVPEYLVDFIKDKFSLAKSTKTKIPSSK